MKIFNFIALQTVSSNMIRCGLFVFFFLGKVLVLTEKGRNREIFDTYMLRWPFFVLNLNTLCALVRWHAHVRCL